MNLDSESVGSENHGNRPLGTHALKTRDSIIEAAKKLLEEDQPEFTTHAVARRANISPATVYQYFEPPANKTLANLVESTLATSLCNSMRDARANFQDSNNSAAARLTRVANTGFTSLIVDSQLFKVLEAQGLKEGDLEIRAQGDLGIRAQVRDFWQTELKELELMNQKTEFVQAATVDAVSYSFIAVARIWLNAPVTERDQITETFVGLVLRKESS